MWKRRVLLEPGDCVAVEEPGYPQARRLFVSQGAQVVGVPVDGEGLVVEALPDDARVVYVTPSHQDPLGMAMSLRRRIALIAWARRRCAAIIEDDYDSEFRYAERPIEPLHALDHAGRVLYVGSFSKVLLPVLRIGFLVAPPSLQQAVRLAKQVTDWHTSRPTQAALARFIEDGLLARHIRRMRTEYRVRHGIIAKALTTDLADLLEIVPSAAGLHLSAFARTGTREAVRAWVQRAEAVGVGLWDLASFSTSDSRPGLVLGYGGIPTDRIPEGLRRLRMTARGLPPA
jgi:GntR family transcriptional regulator/MocR family aminotransferase